MSKLEGNSDEKVREGICIGAVVCASRSVPNMACEMDEIVRKRHTQTSDKHISLVRP